jgi:hypothetical protein
MARLEASAPEGCPMAWEEPGSRRESDELEGSRPSTRSRVGRSAVPLAYLWLAAGAAVVLGLSLGSSDRLDVAVSGTRPPYT